VAAEEGPRGPRVEGPHLALPRGEVHVKSPSAVPAHTASRQPDYITRSPTRRSLRRGPPPAPGRSPRRMLPRDAEPPVAASLQASDASTLTRGPWLPQREGPQLRSSKPANLDRSPTYERVHSLDTSKSPCCNAAAAMAREEVIRALRG